jgi:hypothetical protein
MEEVKRLRKQMEIKNQIEQFRTKTEKRKTKKERQ